MRNLHAFIKEEFGEESVLRLCLWEKIEKKMAHYRNQRRFSIKCLKQEVIPVSIKLKTSIRTTKASEIIRRAEKQLLNEHIRSINNMIEMDMYKRDTYLHQLERVLDQDSIEECKSFIKRVIECRHKRVLDRQRAKFEVLVQQKTSGCSNKDVQKNRAIDSNNNKEERKKWVINLSSTWLTEDQEKLLAHGPKFVITPKETPVSEYITAVEQACTKLEQRKQEEFRIEVKRILKQNQRRGLANVSKEEYKALNELKEG